MKTVLITLTVAVKRSEGVKGGLTVVLLQASEEKNRHEKYSDYFD